MGRDDVKMGNSEKDSPLGALGIFMYSPPPEEIGANIIL